MPNSHLSAGTPLGALGAVCFQTKSFRVAQTKPCFLLKATPISGAKRNVPHGTFRFAVRHLMRTMVSDSRTALLAELFHMEHSVLQSGAKLFVRRFSRGTFKIEYSHCSTWNNRTKRSRTESLRRRRTLCRLTEGSVSTKRFQQKEQEKTPFCIDNPHGFCYNITNVQKRLRPFSAVSFLTQFRPLAGSGQKSGFLAGDRRT